MKKIIFSIAAGIMLVLAVSAATVKGTAQCKASDCTCSTKACCDGAVCTCKK